MTTRRSLYRLLPLIALATISAHVLAQPTATEEKIVRRTYARATMAAEIASVMKHINTSSVTKADFDAEIAADTPSFEIVKMEGGDLASILDVPLTTLLPAPAGMALDGLIAGANWRENDITHWQTGARFAWALAAPAHQLPDGRIVTVGLVLQNTGDYAGSTRYVAVAVRVSFEGKSYVDHALFLVNPAATKTKVKIMDATQGLGNVLASMLIESVYPHVLLETSARSHAVTQHWLATRQVNSCKADGKTECCDLALMRCGVTTQDTRTSLTANKFDMPPEALNLKAPVGGVPPGAKPSDLSVGDCSTYNVVWPIGQRLGGAYGTEGHNNGGHGFDTEDWGGCYYFNPVGAVAGNQCGINAVVNTYPYPYEYGSVKWPYKHVVSGGYVDGYASGVGATVTATAQAQATALNCIGFCNTAITVGPVTYTAGAVWQPVVNRPMACGPQTVPQYAWVYPVDPTPIQCWIYDPSCGPGGEVPVQAKPVAPVRRLQ